MPITTEKITYQPILHLLGSRKQLLFKPTFRCWHVLVNMAIVICLSHCLLRFVKLTSLGCHLLLSLLKNFMGGIQFSKFFIKHCMLL